MTFSYRDYAHGHERRTMTLTPWVSAALRPAHLAPGLRPHPPVGSRARRSYPQELPHCSQHDGRDYLPRIASNTRLKKSTTGVVAFEPTPISSPNVITR